MVDRWNVVADIRALVKEYSIVGLPLMTVLMRLGRPN